MKIYKKVAKIWLYFLISYSLLHLMRDIFQDLGVNNFLSTILVKSDSSKFKTYGLWFNTYTAEIAEIILASICLRRNKFGKIGYLTIFIAVVMVISWFVYFFIL